MLTKKCKWCEVEYENRGSDFCSMKCAGLELEYKLTT
jgi:hypothetical protein